MAAPQRIVSLVPSHTETLHDLGAANRVVGRTRFCIHPAPWVDGIPHVGGTKDADLQKILALKPDLVLVDKDENPLALVQELQAAGVEVMHSEIDTIGDVRDWLIELANRIGCQEAAATAVQAIDDALVKIKQESSESPTPVFCPIWYNPWMTFNDTAYPNAMLEAAGYRNVFADHAGPKYFEVTPAEVAGSGAGATLLPTEPFPFHTQQDKVDTAALGPAGESPRVSIIDGEALTWFGTRTAPGLLELAKARRDD